MRPAEGKADAKRRQVPDGWRVVRLGDVAKYRW